MKNPVLLLGLGLLGFLAVKSKTPAPALAKAPSTEPVIDTAPEPPITPEPDGLVVSNAGIARRSRSRIVIGRSGMRWKMGQATPPMGVTTPGTFVDVATPDGVVVLRFQQLGRDKRTRKLLVSQPVAKSLVRQALSDFDIK
jgi:hypothetical protein